LTFVPVDEKDRERTRRDHATSLVLEAGAGTGKTTLLVDRIEDLVRTGTASLLDIAAVTFTENAAATMKLRLRERLERVRSSGEIPEAERTRAASALEVLERAQVSTIHALCASILQERPLECGVVPGFRVADEAETDALFAAAWEAWLAERLDAGDATLAEAVRADIPLESDFEYSERRALRGLARTLLEERDLEPLISTEVPDPEGWRHELLARASRIRDLLTGVSDGDTLAPRLAALADYADAARARPPAELARYLAALPRIPGRIGQRPKWPSVELLEEGRQIAWWASEAASAWTAALGSHLHARLVTTMLGVVARYESHKKARGVLDFLDLLLKTRDALRDSEAVRRHFAERFRYLIVDEFQDTDPLQVEIVGLLTRGAAGRLVVVGDAKQSIYRFRRAEVALFRRLSAEALARPGHAVLHLTQNFRSRPAILRFVNRAFSTLIQESESSDQPPYEPIDAPPDLPDAASVLQLRFAAPGYVEARDDLLAAESVAIAAFVARTAAGAHEVRDPGSGRLRPSRAGDVMILAPRLTQVRHLEEALEVAGLRFTVEGGKSFFGRQEVHEVLAALRALDDPSDRVSLVAALRSRFFGVSDSDLVAHVLEGRRLGIFPESAETSSHLAAALALLRRLNRERLRSSVPALVERLYEETGILAALTGSHRGEAEIANLEKVVALARQAGGLGILTLRGFTGLLAERTAGGGEEPDLPTARPGDPDTVRILSIHKAKGLEAPIVVLYDQAANLVTRADVIPLWEDRKVAVGFLEGYRPPGWKELAERDKARAWAEGRRLLYVACTRPRDLLVVPRPPADARPGTFWRDLWPFLDASPPSDVAAVDADTLPSPAPLEGFDEALDLGRLGAAEGPDTVALRWQKGREALLAAASERPFVPVAATRLVAGIAPVAAAAAGGGSRELGRLVHRILEWIPFDLESTERATAMAEALGPVFRLDASTSARAAEHVARALSLPVMERARVARRVWRELRLWLPEDGMLIEGIVDLAFEEDGRLVVVDYKTDHLAEADVLAQAAHHAPQLQIYGRGLTQATGLPVAERLVLFTAVGRVVAV
jgi:ATP-dependent helicase/nuclease subunit A